MSEIETLKACIADLVAVARQYKLDLLHQVTDSGSIERRIEAIDAAIEGAERES
jgi:hypothetical protein